MISKNHDGSFHLLYFGVRGANGYSPSSRAVSPRSVRSTLTRWSRQFGKPQKIVGEQLLKADSE